jgi:putative ABC transport system permease protein
VSTERWFRALLRLLPFDFRADYGREMERVFADQYRDARASGGRSGGRLWRQAVLEVMNIAPREHLAQMGQDARHALRAMRKQPAWSAAALVTLALGIGANTAVFGLVWAVLLKPLPYHEPDRLVALWNRWDGSQRAALSEPELLDYAEQARSLQVAAHASGTLNLGGASGDPERLPAAFVTTNLLDVLGVAPTLGRGFRLEEEREGSGRVVLLSDGLWRRRFAADPGVVGRAVTVDGEPFEVAGVLPAGFRFPADFRSDAVAELAVPLPLDRAASRSKRGGHFLQGVARLQPGVTMEAAGRDLDAMLAGLIREYPDEHDQGGFGVWVAPLRNDLLGPARPVLLVLAGAVGLVLALTCANVAGLLLARAEGRRQELAVRTALGADRFRLARQLLTEAAVLAAGGALLGVAVAAATLRAVAALAPASLPRLDQARLDPPVLVFTIGTAALAALAFGALPAFQVGRSGVAGVLKESARGSTSGRTTMRRLLVTGQVAIAVVLLVGAGLLAKSLARVRAVPAGFDSTSVLTLRLTAPESRYRDRDQVAAFFAGLLNDVRALPGARSAGAGSGLPLAVGSGDWSFHVQGRPIEGSKHHGAADWFAVTPGYFESLRVRLASGRLPSDGDGGTAPPVLFLNESAARRFFPGEDPVGRRLRLSRSRGDEQPWREVAGVVGDVRHRGLDRPARPEMYIPHAQFQHFAPGVQARGMSLVVRTDTPPLALAGAVRAAVRRLDPEVPVSQVAAMDAVVTGSLAERRRDVALIGAFALLALVLASVGLYGLIATSVTQRVREIGVRMALGADRGQVARLVLGQALTLVQWGLAVGLAAALLAAGTLREMLFDVHPRDLGVLAAVTAVLLLVGATASLLPAMRAARVDPMTALRQD